MLASATSTNNTTEVAKPVSEPLVKITTGAPQPPPKEEVLVPQAPPAEVKKEEIFDGIPEINTDASTNSNDSSLIVPELGVKVPDALKTKENSTEPVNVPSVLKKEENLKELIEVPSILRNKN